VTAEAAPLFPPFALALVLFFGGYLVLVGLTANTDPSGAQRRWAFAWATLFLGPASVLLSPSELRPVAAAVMGLSPALFLAGSLAFVGRSVPRGVLVLVPLGGLLCVGLALLGPALALGWAVFILAVEGSAAAVLYRRSRESGWSSGRILPVAMGLFAVAHTVDTVFYADQSLMRPLPMLALPFAVLLAAFQNLAVQERIRRASESRERERRESERRFTSLADRSNLVVLILDRDNRVVEWNRIAESIYGWTRAEALGRDYLETFLSEETRPAMQAEITRTLDGAQARGYENCVLTPRGERILRWNVTRLEDDRGQPDGVLALAEDVTDERRQQEEQRRLFAAVEQAGEGIVVAAPDATIRYSNSAFADMMGKRLDEVVGQPVQSVVYSPGDEALVQDLRRTLGEGQLWKGRYASEWPDGRRFVRDATVAPVSGEDGEALYAVGVKLTALGTLAGGIAHDFNNLLTAIIGGAHLLRTANGAREVEGLSDEILEAASRGSALSHQLLAFSRRQPLEAEPLALDRMVEDLRGLLERLIGENIELITSNAQGLWPVSADRSQLEQVIMNLVLNARDAMPRGGKLTLQTSNRHLGERDSERPVNLEPGDYVTLTVSDTGIGMDAETRTRAFEPFFTRKGSAEGTGLGLATVFGVVSQSGGDVSLESAPGQGCRVVVYLPRSEGRAQKSLDEGAAESQRGQEHILLVEDDSTVRRVTCRMLEELGYQVSEAEDGDDARTKLDELGGIDLLLTDVVMPGLGGDELATELRQSHPEIRVLFITGYAGDAQSGPTPDFEGPVLKKPFGPEQLGRKVREALS
jgi:PAS domain S-box-containing protein